MLPYIQDVIVEQYLEGQVTNNGKMTAINKDRKELKTQTDYYTRWEIIIYKGSEQEASYWFNPILSLFMPITLFSFLLSLMLSSILPIKIGLMRHKIEREIFNTIDGLHLKVNKHYSEDNNTSIEQMILKADTLGILNLADDWDISAEDLRYIQTALKWKNGNSLHRIVNTWKALKFYLRFYFTDKYSNVVLGLVYIGAAVLIIIIGMRGLKFIPSTQPSLVFFALGLEFSVLLTYAFTVIYSRSDNEQNTQTSTKNNDVVPMLSSEFGNSKEVENLLRAFLRENKPNVKK
jgi:hypothetical protein